MRVWRIERAAHLRTALSGDGASLYGGRWNSIGTPIVYTSSSLSLAALERFVHAPRVDHAASFFAVGFDLGPDILGEMNQPKPLPADWRAPEPGAGSQAWGDAWTAAGIAACRVPSALLPLDLFDPMQEFNVLLNPSHPLILALKPVVQLPYAFDARMWK